MLLTIAAAARELGYSTRTLRRRIAAGDLPAVRDHGRVKVRADDLRAYVESLPSVEPRRPHPRPRTGRGIRFQADNIGLRKEIGRATPERPRP